MFPAMLAWRGSTLPELSRSNIFLALEDSTYTRRSSYFYSVDINRIHPTQPVKVNSVLVSRGQYIQHAVIVVVFVNINRIHMRVAVILR